MDEDGVIRVGGQTSCYPPFRPLDISFDNSTLPSDRTRWSGNCSGKDHNEVLDPKGSWFSKSVKFHCMLYQESEAKTESQLMMDLPKNHLEPFTPSFYYTACDYSGANKVKISRKLTAKY